VARVNGRWWASFALFAALGLAWVIATPFFAAPDEPAHVIRAASVGRGELLGKKPPPERLIPPIGDAAVEVTAPAIYSGVNVNCFIFQKNVPADCMTVGGPRKEIKVDTWVGHHNPAYYVPVGFLSRIVRPGVGQVMLMRAIGMLIIAALLASCLETLKRVLVPMWAASGFAIAISPMVLFLAATVSPSGVEIGAAVGVWVHGAVLAKEAEDTVDPKLVHRLGIAMCVLVLSRALSPLWVAVIGLVLLILTTRSGLRALARSRRVWAWGAVFGACSAFQIWWYVYGQPLTHFVGTPVEASTPSLVRTSLGKSGEVLREMVGVFGWLDTRAPGVTFFIWIVALGGIAALAIALASRRFVWALLAATAATVVLPVIVESAGAHEAGFIWQGRYSLPLAVGVPIVAGIGVGSSGSAKRLARRLGVVIAAALAVGQILAYAQALRRYAVGADGPPWFFPHARWEPPVPSLVLILGYSLATAVAMWWIVLAPAGLPARRDPDGRADTDSTTSPPDGVVDLGEAPVTV
jgi:Predicted membrane protein (DUF2142)